MCFIMLIINICSFITSVYHPQLQSCDQCLTLRSRHKNYVSQNGENPVHLALKFSINNFCAALQGCAYWYQPKKFNYIITQINIEDTKIGNAFLSYCTGAVI